MRRSLKVSLKFANTNKLNQIESLWVVYKQTTQDYLDRLGINQNLSEGYLKKYDCPLSYRYKQCAKRQALGIFDSWNKNKRKKGKPIIESPSMILDSRFIEFQKSKKTSFNYVVKIATLEKGKPVLIPVKSYGYLNQYLKNWRLIDGGRLLKQNNQWLIQITFEKEDTEIKDEGETLGIDIGIKKLIVDSDGNQYGKDIEGLMDKIQRKEQGSKAFKRALKERDCYINKTVKELPFETIKTITVENIKNIKLNTKKKKRLGKEFRSKFQRWTYSKLISRIRQLAEVGGVHYLLIAPAYTSQTCSECGFVSKLNRNGEIFLCKNCYYTTDADFNASKNILNLGLAQQSMVAGRVKNNVFL